MIVTGPDSASILYHDNDTNPNDQSAAEIVKYDGDDLNLAQDPICEPFYDRTGFYFLANINMLNPISSRSPSLSNNSQTTIISLSGANMVIKVTLMILFLVL